MKTRKSKELIEINEEKIPKNKVITLRVTDEEKKLLKMKARRTRKTLSAYILSKTIK